MLSEKVLEIKTTLPIQWILMEGKSDWLESFSFLFLYHLDYFFFSPISIIVRFILVLMVIFEKKTLFENFISFAK